MATGADNEWIALNLAISVRTVQSHLTSVFQKLGVSSRTHAVVEALRRGLIDLDLSLRCVRSPRA